MPAPHASIRWKRGSSIWWVLTRPNHCGMVLFLASMVRSPLHILVISGLSQPPAVALLTRLPRAAGKAAPTADIAISPNVFRGRFGRAVDAEVPIATVPLFEKLLGGDLP